ncbi:2-oxoacid:acceptor oxidoreductase subunit alpha [Patescibacteria group bacterium]|nr:2-oxoacid:acceptor oxidoreductase subunit alpha [Patescibacteria group bacterium]MBU4099117.1 2-oxoacid:acceptor oxidoreductase subunit alpha [Patescibacteria group bacterium]
MAKQEFISLKIGGYAGQGIKSAGLMFAKLATRSGYNIYTYTEYPSLIRGGHNAMQICVSSEEVTAPSNKTDLLIALNQETITKHLSELSEGGGIIFDADKKFDFSKVDKNINLFLVPLSKLTGGHELLINTAALGVATALFGGEIKILKDLISEEFSGKKEEVVEMNHKAVEQGYNFANENFADKLQNKLSPRQNVSPKMILNGNEAAALGAIAGGLQFAAIYPMTPITGLLHMLAAYQEKYGFIYKQPEDEIAAINMTIGAAFAGARAMTATSGGGFCLMTEGYGLAGMTETPIVIIMGMRAGPATGLPTWSEQGDLRFVLHAHQGDFPRIVLAAGDGKEAFDLTMQAFNLAEKYQTPVVVLVDKNICEDDQSYIYFDVSKYKIERGKFTTEKVNDYKRYALEQDGISARTVPGTGNFFIANSDEHNTYGYSDEESANRKEQYKKRMNKLRTCETQDMPAPTLYGPENPDVTIVSWGSNKGSIMQSMKEFPNVNFLHLTWMNPFPSETVKQILSGAKHVVDIECNYTAQLAGLIREKTGIEIEDKFLKYDGRPFFVEEIAEKLRGLV